MEVDQSNTNQEVTNKATEGGEQKAQQPVAAETPSASGKNLFLFVCSYSLSNFEIRCDVTHGTLCISGELP